MSGLTGYLLTDGTDLSYVFMPRGGGGVSLSANNIFTGTNTFSALTTINGGLALPSTGIEPSTGQLGSTYFLQGSSFIGPTANAANVATISASTLSAGTYLVNLVYSYNIANNPSGAGVLRSIQMNVTQTSAKIDGPPSNTNLLTYGSVLNYSAATGIYVTSVQISGTMYLANTTTPIYITAKITTNGNATLSLNQSSTYCQFTRIS